MVRTLLFLFVSTLFFSCNKEEIEPFEGDWFVTDSVQSPPEIEWGIDRNYTLKMSRKGKYLKIEGLSSKSDVELKVIPSDGVVTFDQIDLSEWNMASLTGTLILSNDSLLIDYSYLNSFGEPISARGYAFR